MEFSQMLSELLNKKQVVVININDKKDQDDRLAMLIERLIKIVSGQNKSTPMG